MCGKCVNVGRGGQQEGGKWLCGEREMLKRSEISQVYNAGIMQNMYELMSIRNFRVIELKNSDK